MDTTGRRAGPLSLLGPFLTLLAPACSDGQEAESRVRFVDGTVAAGIVFQREDGRYGDYHYPETACAGAIFFDADGDGDPDLYLLDGTRLGGQPPTGKPSNVFYTNDAGRFTDATLASGLGDSSFSAGVCGADYDNDGDIDLYVTNFAAPNALYRNDGSGHFVDVASASGVEGVDEFDSSCAFADVNGDGWLDLFVANCLDATPDDKRVCEVVPRGREAPVRRYCRPVDYDPVPDQLYLNRGDGTFEDASERSGIAAIAGRSLGAAFCDFDDDGDPDLLVTCDQTPNLFYENQGDGSFREIGVAAGVALGPMGEAQAGMGVATGDFDGDQRMDVVVTYFEEEWNGWYRNEGGCRFSEIAPKNGTRRSCYFLMGWGVTLFDADLDTDLDALIANGHLNDDVALFRDPVAGFAQPNDFLENQGDGQFVSLASDAGPGLSIEAVSRGVATADVDGDGDLDVLVVNLRGRPDLLINESPRNGRHWLMVRTVGSRSNRDGVGARVSVHLPERTLVREVYTGQSYQSQSDMRPHFGLGTNAIVPRLEVRWPSGARSVLENVPADRVVEVVEPERS